jgi:hypothetical protein
MGKKHGPTIKDGMKYEKLREPGLSMPCGIISILIP